MANFGTILVPKETDFAIRLNEYYVTKWRNYSNWKHMYKFPTKHFWSQKPCDICGATIIAFLLNGDFYCGLSKKPNLLQTKHADSMRWSYRLSLYSCIRSSVIFPAATIKFRQAQSRFKHWIVLYFSIVILEQLL